MKSKETIEKNGPAAFGDEAALRMNTVNRFLRETFGRKMIKLALDGGFTCPNRDGTKGTGGCLFCGAGAGGDFASDIPGQIRLYAEKWPDAGFLAYFQNHTNTYAPVPVLRKKFEAALADPRIEGLVIATRPDCLPNETIDLLQELAEDHFLWVELGLQTIHEETAERINRAYPLAVYDDAVKRLSQAGIRTVTHLILGLPGETKAQMEESVRYVTAREIWGIKLHLLNVVRGSRLAEEMPDYVPFDSMEEYVSLVCDLVEIIPREITIHRLTAEAPRGLLISPPWARRKREILNSIRAELRRRGSVQGCRAEK